MTYLKWTPDLSVGDDTLDRDHMKLIDLINMLHRAMTDPVSNGVGTVLTELLDYTRYHFAEEERVMKAIGFPDLDAHRWIHAKMTRQVTDMYQRFIQDPTSVPAEETFTYLSEWLVRHIMAKDLPIRQYVVAMKQSPKPTP